MNLIEEANLIEETEKNLDIVIEGALRRGLSALQILRVLTIFFQNLLIRHEAELCLRGN